MRINKWIPVALAINIILLLLYSMRSQAATLEKDINSYVGEVKFSDTRMSIRLTFDDANIGTLKISSFNTSLKPRSFTSVAVFIWFSPIL